MRADVPVGALLSGGIDSSAIVAIMKKYTDKPIHTYALGFDKEDEDLRRARLMANKLGTIHKEFYFNPEEQWDVFQKLLKVYGEPIMLLPLIHTYFLCRAIKNDGIKVVMSGNGADEIFYGYTGHVRTYQVSRWLDRLYPFIKYLDFINLNKFKWLTTKPGKRKSYYYASLAKKDWESCFTQESIKNFQNYSVSELEYWGQLTPSQHFIDESNFVSLMVENTHSVTTAGDLPAMMASVEIRCPFLDQELIEFALNVPVEKKIPDKRNLHWLKAILREAVQDLIPEELLKASKRGFGMGIQESMVLSGPWYDKAYQLFNNLSDINEIFDIPLTKRAWFRFQERKINANFVAKLLSIQQWNKIINEIK